MQEFINTVGAVAEITLLFYRNLIEAGAKLDEALRLTEIFIRAAMFSENSGSKPTEDKKD